MSQRIVVPRDVAEELDRLLGADIEAVVSFLEENGLRATAGWARHNPVRFSLLARGFRPETPKQPRKPVLHRQAREDPLEEMRRRFGSSSSQDTGAGTQRN